MPTSSAAVANTLIRSAQYNDLRTDVRSTHNHDGTEGNAAIAATSFTGIATVSGAWIRTASLTFNDNVSLLFGTSGGEGAIVSNGTRMKIGSVAGKDVEIGDDVTLLFIDGGLNGGAGGIGLGGTPTSGRNFLRINKVTYVVNTDGGGSYIEIVPALTEAGSGTHSRMIGVDISALVLTSGVGATTTAATVRIAGAPSGATNNYALWVDDGAVQLDGNLTVGGTISGLNLSDYTTQRLSGSTAVTAGTDTVVTIQAAADSIKHYSLSIRSNDGSQILEGVHVEPDETVTAAFHSVIGRPATSGNDALHLINGLSSTETAQYEVLEFD